LGLGIGETENLVYYNRATEFAVVIKAMSTQLAINLSELTNEAIKPRDLLTDAD